MNLRGDFVHFFGLGLGLVRRVEIRKIVREQERASDREQEDIEQAVGEVDDVDEKCHGIRDVVMCEGAIPRS
jgi:hypothetical protein